jgi:hypothetical protein
LRNARSKRSKDSGCSASKASAWNAFFSIQIAYILCSSSSPKPANLFTRRCQNLHHLISEFSNIRHLPTQSNFPPFHCASSNKWAIIYSISNFDFPLQTAKFSNFSPQ